MSETNPITQAAADAAVDAALAAFAAATTLAELKQARTEHAGESSALAALNAQMRAVPKDQKAATGKLMGQSRGRVEGAYSSRETELAAVEAAARLVAETVDVTEAPTRRRSGTRHPLAQLQDEISEVFVGMGWEVAEGPELEHEWFNFDALGFDPDHPARAMQDTFFVEPAERHLVLRTHTSPVQVRSLLSRELPLYVIAPGRVYRTDETGRGWHPTYGAYMNATMKIEYLPRRWEAPFLNGSYQSATPVSLDGHYRWTRGGLQGNDVGGREIKTGT